MAKDNLVEEFESFLCGNLPQSNSFHPNFNIALGKMLLAGGKRFRPLLLLGVVDACEPLMLKNAMHAALALEMIHTYSLIHDDLPSMDNAELRRGNKTLHVSYDEATAVLVGDGLNTEAFGVLGRAPFDPKTKIDLINVLCYGSGINGMIIGQALDCFFENTKLDEEKLSFIHEHKTGKLIAASLVMGGIIVKLPQDELLRLEKVGLLLGLAFQIQDDLIDALQSSKEAGKTTNNDSQKNSYVNLLSLSGAKSRLEDTLQKCEESIESLDIRLHDMLKNTINIYFKRGN